MKMTKSKFNSVISGLSGIEKRMGKVDYDLVEITECDESAEFIGFYIKATKGDEVVFDKELYWKRNYLLEE